MWLHNFFNVFVTTGKWIVHGSYEYLTLNNPVSWSDANEVCTHFNQGHLVSMTSTEENNFVKEQLEEAK